MAQTDIPIGHPLAAKMFGVALLAAQQRSTGFNNNLTGPAPKQASAEAKLKGQTSPDMPIVRVTDLTKVEGDTVSVDLFNMISGKPIVGDRNAEGKGERLSASSMDIRIDLVTKVVDAGGKMANQRTVHQLRGVAMANLTSWWRRFEDQTSLVHLAGARGSQDGMDWVVPLASDADFSEIVVNPVKAPTYNRHFVANGTGITRGGAQLASIASTDVLKIEHLDALKAFLMDSDNNMQPVKIADDPAAEDDPMWILYVTPAQWQSMLAATGSNTWRQFLAAAFQRKSYGSKHPLFSGEPGMWNGILVRQLPRSIRFNPGDGVAYNASLTDVGENGGTPVTVNAGLGAGKAVDRALLLGAQALGNVYGRNKASDYHVAWLERQYNFKRNYEVAADAMGGKAKLRFKYADKSGTPVPTDHGVLAFDTAVSVVV